MRTDSPVLFLVFNRPDVSRRVFERIRSVRPKKLFVAADGPREHIDGESERCRQTREIVEKIDWDCELHTRFSDYNQGCGKGVSSAISWFFSHVERGIILEDDCLPDPSFFSFCDEMLEKYANESLVMHVSGDNFQDGRTRGDGSYYFSRFAHIWGWATWRRVWDLYDFAMTDLPAFVARQDIRKLHADTAVQNHFLQLFRMMYEKPIDTWDFQLLYTIVKNGGLCINPNLNLVTNLGFGADATHTVDEANKYANLASYSMAAIKHPSKLMVDTEADDYSLRTIFGVKLTEQVAKRPWQFNLFGLSR